MRPSKVVEPLESAARDLKRTPAAANIRYSLAKALVTTSRVRSGHTRNVYQERAAQLLKSALDSGGLSLSRQRRAVDALGALDYD